MDLLETLKRVYPDAGCELEHGSDFELLVSVILSAQCTDKRVNTVTRELFKAANTPQAICDMPTDVLEGYIKSCGLYKHKAASIKSCAAAIVSDYNGQVPQEMDKLLTLAGVGRKTANVMLSVAFGKPAIAVDTHVYRVAHRIGLSDGKTPDDVERDLCAAFDPSDYRTVHYVLIKHGRDCCHARAPECDRCEINGFCAEYAARNG